MYVCIHCVVDGGWSSWTCGSCSKTCGGTKTCTRRCNNPTPACGGNDCPGSKVDERSCLINNPGKVINVSKKISRDQKINYAFADQKYGYKLEVVYKNHSLFHCLLVKNNFKAFALSILAACIWITIAFMQQHLNNLSHN